MPSESLNENDIIEYQGTCRPHQTKGHKIISEFAETTGLISPRNKTS